MAVKKIVIRPEGNNDYADELHPRTSVDQVVGQILFQTASGTNTYTTTDANVSAYTAGLRVTIKFTNANTSASTLNINGLGAKSIVKAGGGALSSGNLKAGGVYTLVYDGVNFQLQGEGGEYGTATASDVLAGKTIGTGTGIVSGTIPSKGAATITPSTVNQTIAAGQYLSGIQTIAGDADLVASNIKSGANIFGVAGAANIKEVLTHTASGVTLGALGTYNLPFVPDVVVVTGSITYSTMGTRTGLTYSYITGTYSTVGLLLVSGTKAIEPKFTLSGSTLTNASRGHNLDQGSTSSVGWSDVTIKAYKFI
jgi:hypothetical protein